MEGKELDRYHRLLHLKLKAQEMQNQLEQWARKEGLVHHEERMSLRVVIHYETSSEVVVDNKDLLRKNLFEFFSKERLMMCTDAKMANKIVTLFKQTFPAGMEMYKFFKEISLDPSHLDCFCPASRQTIIRVLELNGIKFDKSHIEP